MSAYGTKRTCRSASLTSASDPKRTAVEVDVVFFSLYLAGASTFSGMMMAAKGFGTNHL
jgi:hypothetical protein